MDSPQRVRILTDPLSLISSNRFVSFLNPQNLNHILSNGQFVRDIDFCVDSGILCWLIRLRWNIRVTRFSFDFAGIADEYFQFCEKSMVSLAVIGASDSELRLFAEKIKGTYPRINLKYTHHGYFDNSGRDQVIRSLLELDIESVVVGLGVPKQEEFLSHIKNSGYQGSAYTCGAFISQTAKSENLHYYPKFVNQLRIRFLYRLYFEPHTRLRYFTNFFPNLVKFLKHAKPQLVREA